METYEKPHPGPQTDAMVCRHRVARVGPALKLCSASSVFCNQMQSPGGDFAVNWDFSLVWQIGTKHPMDFTGLGWARLLSAGLWPFSFPKSSDIVWHATMILVWVLRCIEITVRVGHEIVQFHDFQYLFCHLQSSLRIFRNVVILLYFKFICLWRKTFFHFYFFFFFKLLVSSRCTCVSDRVSRQSTDLPFVKLWAVSTFCFLVYLDLIFDLNSWLLNRRARQRFRAYENFFFLGGGRRGVHIDCDSTYLPCLGLMYPLHIVLHLHVRFICFSFHLIFGLKGNFLWTMRALTPSAASHVLFFIPAKCQTPRE